MMKKTFFILLLFISSCGYQPIYLNKTLKNFEFKKIIFDGDNYINKKKKEQILPGSKIFGINIILIPELIHLGRLPQLKIPRRSFLHSFSSFNHHRCARQSVEPSLL